MFKMNQILVFSFFVICSSPAKVATFDMHTTEQNKSTATDWKHYRKGNTKTRTMGLKGAASILFHAKGITMTGLKRIARTRLAENEHICRIDVDCSWLGYKLARSSSDTDASMLTAEVLLLLAKAGFVVTPICDPPHRHHSKRASTDRIAKKERKRIDSLVARYKITELSQRLQDVNISAEDRGVLSKELGDLNKKSKSLERNETSGRLGGLFIEDLQRDLDELSAHEKNEHECFVEEVVVSSFQADSVIAQRVVTKKSHLILGNDTDFMVLVGPSCVAVRDFKIKRGAGKDC